MKIRNRTTGEVLEKDMERCRLGGHDIYADAYRRSSDKCWWVYPGHHWEEVKDEYITLEVKKEDFDKCMKTYGMSLGDGQMEKEGWLHGRGTDGPINMEFKVKS